jgi:hypothetical protein
MDDPIEVPPVDDPEAKLERAFVDQFLAQQGESRQTLAVMPETRRMTLLREARKYASERLAEVQARAHYVGELHRE